MYIDIHIHLCTVYYMPLRDQKHGGHPSIRDFKITLHFLSVGVAATRQWPETDGQSASLGNCFFHQILSVYKLLIQPKSNPNRTRASCKKGTVNMVVPLVTKQPAWEGGSCPDSCPFACAIKTTALIIIFRAMAIQIMATDEGRMNVLVFRVPRATQFYAADIRSHLTRAPEL